MIETLDRGLGRVTLGLAYLGCAVICGLFVLIILDVLIRTFGTQPPAFTLAVVEYGLLYFAMCATPYLVRTRGHVVIEAVVASVPRGVQTLLARLVYFVCMVIALLFAYESALLFLEAWESGNLDMRGIDIALWLQYLPMPFGFAFIGLEFVPYLLGLRSYYSYDLGEVKDTV
ncbi:MAG: TRAP transporter small permease [Rhodospirillales bacterium]